MNYESMTDQELDKLAAVNIAGFEWMDRLHVKDAELNYIVDGSEWHPTHPDSNQCERYLFPRLTGHSVTTTAHDDGSHSVKVQVDDFNLHYRDLCESSGAERDQLNRTKTIACLQAWEKLK